MDVLPGKDNDFLNAPEDIAIFKKWIFIADFKNSRILRLNKDLSEYIQIGKKGLGPGELINPSNIFVKNDTIYIVSGTQVHVFDLMGKYKRTIKFPVRLYYGIAINSKYHFFVGNVKAEIAKHTKHIISEFDKYGYFNNSFGEYTDIHFNHPLTTLRANRAILAIDSLDNIYAAFPAQPIIRKYDKNKKLIWETDLRTQLKNVENKFNKILDEYKNRDPHGISIVIHNISVSDYVYLVTIFKPYEFLALDKETGEVKFNIVIENMPNDIYPTKIASDGKDRLYFVSFLSNKIGFCIRKSK
ncbi:MAG: 6-bladed beta-propeller [Candidatus Helarchaeota archaeon]